MFEVLVSFGSKRNKPYARNIEKRSDAITLQKLANSLGYDDARIETQGGPGSIPLATDSVGSVLPADRGRTRPGDAHRAAGDLKHSDRRGGAYTRKRKRRNDRYTKFDRLDES